LATYNTLTDRDAGAALIPEEAASEIIKGTVARSAALSLFRRVRMARAQTRMPVVSVLPQAYWVNGDTGRKQTSGVEWDNIFLDARELAVIVPVPEAVLDDADYDIWGEVTPLVAEAFGQKIDAATLFGVDSPWSESYQQGITEQAALAGNLHTEGTSASPHDDFAGDVSDTMGLVEDDGFDVTGFMARRKVRRSLRNLRDDNGQPLFQDVRSGGGATLYGEPIAWVSNDAWVNNYELIAGDVSAAILGLRQDITYKILTEGVISDDNGVVVLNLAQQDAVALRAVMRVGWAVANPVTREVADDADRFPFAVLVNAGS
jgi:HK97 family phage major capsid protein